MNTHARPRVVTVSMALCRWLLGCYPRRTRERFGEELADVCESLLADAYADGGIRAALACWPRLYADLLVALGMDYLDAWRTARVPPAVFAATCLAIAAAVWTLILVASYADAHWAAGVLDFNLTLTVLLAFGLPMAALFVTRIERRLVTQGRGDTVVGRLSAGATFASWAILACHLA